MAKEAIKENLNKISFVDIPIEAVEALAKVFQTSKNSGKYPRDNHFKPIKNTELIDAIFRHLIEVIKGNDMDNSGNSHYSHIMANAAMLQYHFEKGSLIENRCKFLNNVKKSQKRVLDRNKKKTR